MVSNCTNIAAAKVRCNVVNGAEEVNWDGHEDEDDGDGDDDDAHIWEGKRCSTMRKSHVDINSERCVSAPDLTF